MTEPNATPEPPKPKKRRWFLVLLLLVLLGGGGFAGWYFLVRVTVDDVRARYRERFAELRAKLKRVEANLPPLGSVKEDSLPANLDPKPAYDREKRTGNNAFVMADGGDKAGGDSGSRRFTLSSYRFVGAMNEFGGDVPPSSKTAGKELAEEYERALALKYLVVCRVVRFEPIKVTDGSLGDPTFAGGAVDLEVFLVDLATEKQLGAIRRSFRPDDSVLATVRKGKVDTSSVRNTLFDSIERKAAVDVKLALERATGGTFE